MAIHFLPVETHTSTPERARRSFHMSINPCRQCKHMNKDKNNAVCLRCDKRLRYVAILEAAMGFTISSAEEAGYSPLHLPNRSSLS
jgi:uncharacterized paraquat-inducible protein A